MAKALVRLHFEGLLNSSRHPMKTHCPTDTPQFQHTLPIHVSLADAVAEAFVRLHSEGLVYRGSYMVNWSPSLLTAVSDLEVDYSEEPGFMYYFK